MPIFNKDDEIFRSKPFSIALSEDNVSSYCAVCLSPQPQHACSICGHIFYCSPKCQSDDHKYHSYECPSFSRMPKTFNLNQYTRLLVRALVRSNEDVTEKVLGVERSIKSLIHHDEVLEDEEIMSFFGERYLELRSYYPDLDTTPDEVLDMFKRIWVNCQTLCDRDEKPIALALYLGQSVLDHSCVISQEYTFCYEGSDFVLRALVDGIEINSPDQLRIPYICVIQPRQLRHQDLSRWYFECKCPMCTDEVEEIITNNHVDIYGQIITELQELQRTTKSKDVMCSSKFAILQRYLETDLKEVPPTDFTKFTLLHSLSVDELLPNYTKDQKSLAQECLAHVVSVYQTVYGSGYSLFESFKSRSELISRQIEARCSDGVT